MKFLQSVLILSGMIIGAGVFAIPFSFARAGFLLGAIELAALTAVMLLYHLSYAEIVMKTGESHRLPGYIKIYLGAGAGTLTWIISLLDAQGTILAYLILGGVFLNGLLPFFAFFRAESVVFFIAALAAFITLFPLRKEALINGILTAFLIVFLALLGILLLPSLDPAHFTGIRISEFFLPYGVLLFALSGGTVIPELVSLLGHNKRDVRRAVAIGTVLPALLYFFFAFSLVGVFGEAVSEDTMRSLRGFGDGNLALIGHLIGFLSIFTSLVLLSANTQSLLRLDLGFSRAFAWVFVSALPFFLYLGGIKNYLPVIGFVGAVAVGIQSSLVIAAHHRLEERESPSHSFVRGAFKIGLSFLFFCGMLYEVSRIF